MHLTAGQRGWKGSVDYCWRGKEDECHNWWTYHWQSCWQLIVFGIQIKMQSYGRAGKCCKKPTCELLKHTIYHLSCKDKLPMVNELYDSILLNLTHLDILFSVSSGVAFQGGKLLLFGLFEYFERFTTWYSGLTIHSWRKGSLLLLYKIIRDVQFVSILKNIQWDKNIS